MDVLVRSASLTNYVEVASSLKIDPLQQLRLVGLDPRCLVDSDMKIPVVAVSRLLENSAHEAGVEDFGLRMAETRTLSNLGPLALVLRDERTVREALQVVRDFLHLHNQGLVMQLEEADGIAVLRVDQVTAGKLAIRQGMELSIAVTHRTLKTLLGHHWHPRVVCFSHSAPKDESTHRRVFGGSVQFNGLFDGIVCRSVDLDSELPGANPELAPYIHQYLQSIRSEAKAALLEKVRQVIWVLLPTGRCTVEKVAEHLGRDRRTLHRQLLKEGESFTSMLNQVRSEVAMRHLLDSGHALGDIAALLGFSELSAFTRWFTRQHGCSPSKWRSSKVGAPA